MNRDNLEEGLDYVSLEYQRRMKTRFAKFLIPIYPNYRSHTVINNRNLEFIPELREDMLLFDHRYRESRSNLSTSTHNLFEAEMIAGFASFLVRAGFSPSKITILSMYLD